jgi:protein ImuB
MSTAPAIPRRVGCVHVPAFSLQAAARCDLALRGIPLALEGEAPQRGRVVECCARAQDEGVHEGQTLAQARAACPQLRILQADASALARARHDVHEALLEISPRIAWSGQGTFCFDATGLHRLHGSETSMLVAAVEALRGQGLVARAAVASTRFIAALAARSRPGACVVRAGQEQALLEGLPLRALAPPLRLEQVERLELLGMRTVAQFSRLPPDGIADRFGREVARLLLACRGEEPAPLVALPSTDLPRAVREMDEPLQGLEPLVFLLKSCCEELADCLAQRGMTAARLEIRIALDGGGEDVRVLTPSRPLAAAKTLLALARLELEERRLRAPLVGLALSILEEAPVRGLSGELFGGSLDVEALASAVDRVRALVGSEHVVTPAPQAAHRREARVGWNAYAPESAVRAAVATADEEPSDDPGERLLDPPLFACVRLPVAGRPGEIVLPTAERAALPLCGRADVVACAGPVRLMGEWWDGGADVDRDEYLLVLSTGGALRACRDRRTRSWTLLSVLD